MMPVTTAAGQSAARSAEPEPAEGRRRILFIKVYGERNTGTNWHEKLLRRNFGAKLFGHDGFRYRVPETEGREAFEAAMDRVFEVDGPDVFGWKHAAPRAEVARANARFKGTGFVLVTKNPYWFIRSLKKRPYNRLVAERRHEEFDVDGFALAPWPLLGRDGLEGEVCKTAAHLWNEKTRALLTFLEEAPERSILVRYEDTLIDFQESLGRIAKKFGFREGPYGEFERDIKSADVLGIDYYRERYLSTDYAATYRPETLKKLDEALDADLMERLGYARPEQAP